MSLSSARRRAQGMRARRDRRKQPQPLRALAGPGWRCWPWQSSTQEPTKIQINLLPPPPRARSGNQKDKSRREKYKSRPRSSGASLLFLSLDALDEGHGPATSTEQGAHVTTAARRRTTRHGTATRAGVSAPLGLSLDRWRTIHARDTGTSHAIRDGDLAISATWTMCRAQARLGSAISAGQSPGLPLSPRRPLGMQPKLVGLVRTRDMPRGASGAAAAGAGTPGRRLRRAGIAEWELGGQSSPERCRRLGARESQSFSDQAPSHAARPARPPPPWPHK